MTIPGTFRAKYGNMWAKTLHYAITYSDEQATENLISEMYNAAKKEDLVDIYNAIEVIHRMWHTIKGLRFTENLLLEKEN
jgi:hypothetical protein